MSASASLTDLGIFTLDQVAQMLPFGDDGPDPATGVARLIARGSLRPTRIAGTGDLCINKDAFMAFLDSGNPVGGKGGMPKERLRPLYPIEGRWFDTSPYGWVLSQLEEAVARELDSQLLDGSNPGDVPGKVTPQITSLINEPLPDSQFGHQSRVAGATTVGQLWCMRALVESLRRTINEVGQADPQNIFSHSLEHLYESPSAYTNYVQKSQEWIARRWMVAARNYPAVPIKTDGFGRITAPRIEGGWGRVYLSCPAIMKIIGIDLQTLAALAL